MLGAWERLERDFLVRFPDVAIAQFGDPTVAAREALGDEAYERAFEQGLDLDLAGIAQLATAEGQIASIEGRPD